MLSKLKKHLTNTSLFLAPFAIGFLLHGLFTPYWGMSLLGLFIWFIVYLIDIKAKPYAKSF